MDPDEALCRSAIRVARGDAELFRAAFSRADLVAGMTVGLVALPLAMAFGVAPQAGLYTAIVGGFVVAVFGGARLQVAGPTGAFVVIVAGIVAKHGMAGLLMVTMMAGAILVVLGPTSRHRLHQRDCIIDRFDADQRFSGFDIVMASSTLDTTTSLLALGSLALIIVVPRFLPRVPGAIVALIVATAVVATISCDVIMRRARCGLRHAR